MDNACSKAAGIVREFEGFMPTPYKDPLGIWTVGYGTTVYPDGVFVKKRDPMVSVAAAEEYLAFTIGRKCLNKLTKIPTWDTMNDNQKAALLDFGYNLGENFYAHKNFESITNVCDSPERWNDHEWIESQFVKYRNPGSAVEDGLRRRRVMEAKVFCEPV